MAKNIALGILAHVDAGKTTLTESMLLKSGAIRRAGRVDHRDSFLDTDAQERERGITIYDKNAMFEWRGTPITVIDTPGHTDFAGETERALSVLDAAVLVVSGPSSVQSHTRTLWKLCDIYDVPVFIFVNKMDMQGTDEVRLLKDLKQKLSHKCEKLHSEAFCEAAAESDEKALESYLESGRVDDATVKQAIASRQLFPCIFGSALNHEGTETLLDAISKYALSKTMDGELSAKIYKIARDARGERLAFLKVMSGEVRVRMPILNTRNPEAGEEKLSSIRFYSGDKYRTADTAPAGSVCAVTGLKNVIAGDTLGQMTESVKPVLEPVFTYRANLPEGTDASTALRFFRILEDEDPLLRVSYSERLREISIQVMGEVALEILTRSLKDRFGLDVSFDDGSILYKETIAAPVVGMGHYEPLRHYAEVHLRLDPAPRGSGVSVRSEVSVDDLALSWQRLIFTHVLERTHAGVLTGSPLTDVTFTLIAGRAHLKHTEGGDFRQATYRAIRQGLMKAQSVLLEPWYEMRLTLPTEYTGRAMNDITRMGGSFTGPETLDDTSLIVARVPVRLARGYQREVTAYTRGTGSMSLNLFGYEACPDKDKIVAQIGYEPERDIDNPADSVFCSHGAGTLVSWREAEAHMHIKPEKERDEVEAAPVSQSRSGEAYDEELKAIFERTYGKRDRRIFDKPPAIEATPREEPAHVMITPKRPEYLLVDGYNIIHAWPELKGTLNDLERGRKLLSDILDNYAGQTDAHIILVFDAYKVKHNPGSSEKYGHIEIVYTREAQTADSYIEKLAYELSKNNRVRVATSDGMEQLIILGSGALRMTASELKGEIEKSVTEIRKIMENMRLKTAGTNIGKVIGDAMSGKDKK
ncbi:MAG: TetM/TetW/TetO/TetS family tetracycline resistance ribosomal protection protein [Clostridia bacterium]|nr:TetM/TetW/TetO/TetS family tetracycline resistance ribosomal protection protein [Clostridia bacterium]